MTAAKPKASRAVVSDRARTAPGALDFYPTPPWGARAGGELIRRLDPLARSCWEPACGEGHMVHGLADYFDSVVGSDIYDYRGPVPATTIGDFLGDDWAAPDVFDWVVTNPPFVTAEAFARKALARARRGVALLCRLAFLEGAIERWALYCDHPLNVVAPFAQRLPMHKGRWEPDGSTTTAYAWFIWLQPGATGFSIDPSAWLHPQVMPIAPTAKDRLHRADDVRLFCPVAEAPLFDWEAVVGQEAADA